MKGSEAFASSNHTTAVYKGLIVDVYTVDKSEISLSRQDLVELINVCTVLLRVINSRRPVASQMFGWVVFYKIVDPGQARSQTFTKGGSYAVDPQGRSMG